MKSILAVLVSVISFCGSLLAQSVPAAPVYFERSADSLYTFYFDSQYFLVEKNCEFQSIRRVGRYNPEIKSFEGSFSDFGPEGNLLLTGSYKDGKRDGTFKGFHSTGFLKWEATFDQGRPEGFLYFYYEDGSPMSILQLKNDRIFVVNTWNRKGKPRVKKGKGRFELHDPQFGFNEEGYDHIVYKGRVKEGLPHGTWYISYGFPDGSEEILALERFKDGRFIEGQLKGEPYKSSILQYGLSDPYRNAERFIAKGCTIDEHLNFSYYLSEYLGNRFASYSFDSTLNRQITFTLQVSPSGGSSDIVINKGSDDPVFNKTLALVLQSIPYWVPSQKEGRIISDTLVVSSVLIADSSGRPAFTNLKIERKEGS